MERQQGGEMWEQGADGCIFNPSVACKDDTVPNQENTVSKIIPKGSIDERVEEFIAQHFPHVVAGKGVLIAQKRCTPHFIPTNLVKQKKISNNTDGPCYRVDSNNPEAYTNFVYEKYDFPFSEISRSLSEEYTKRLLQRALNAGVALVPDDGPWVIGLDFHVANIFTKYGTVKEPYSSLADWGRTLIIENPHDFSSIQKGIQETFESLKKSKIVNDSFLSFLKGANYDQFGVVIRQALNNLRAAKSEDDTFKTNLNRLRVNSVYGLLRSCKKYTRMGYIPIMDNLLSELLQTTSQQDIVSTINKYFGANYIDLNAFFPKTTRGGKRKTKKALKKSKKRKTRR